MKMFLISLISILFMNLNNPFMLGMLIILQTMNLMLMMGKIYYSFWFSYILFLVFIGGLFILFFYLISLIYNNKFSYYFNKKMLLFLSLLMFINYKNYFFMNSEKMISINYYNEEINLIKLYNFPNNFINLMMIILLLLMMIIVVKISNFYKGPIRSK